MTAWLSLLWVRVVGLLLLVASIAGFGAYEMHKHDVKKYDDLQKQFVTFKITTAALGEVAKKQNALIALHDLKAKERNDEEYARQRAIDAHTVAGLRNAIRAGSGGLSAPAPRASSPYRICFDPAKFGAALRSLDEGLLGIVEGGTAAVTGLDTAKRWAQDLSK